MCGIAGFIDPDGSRSEQIITRQLQTLHHRGPDSLGFHQFGRAMVGQTRLAIIDLVTGDPPVGNEDGTVGVALNGELYNYQELRSDLQRRGHTFSTSGDTEVIAHLAEDLDPVDVARCLHGMFSFAVWDDKRERLTLGRDRLGKKPLYYWTDGRRLVFGSEIKALMEHPAVPRRLDPEAIPAYLGFGYVPTPRTFYEGVLSVPPGHLLILEQGKPPRLIPYWRPLIPPMDGTVSVDATLDEMADEVRRLLTDAIRRRLVGDVPIGAFLSGGIDSSSVVAIMSRLMDRPVRTFSIGFEDYEGYDERPYARLIAERFRTDHTEFVVKPDAIELIEELVRLHDQPFGDSSAIPTYLVSRLTRDHVTVALSGDGGDELFAGYERFAAALAAERYTQVPRPVRVGAERLVGHLSPSAMRGRAGSIQRFARRAGMGLPGALREWVSYVSSEDRAALLDGTSDWGGIDYERRWSESRESDTLDRLLLLNIRTYLLDDLLPKVDRTSMGHALEVRCPMLDHHLLEYALRLPRKARISRFTLKRIIKYAMKDLLPEETLRRSKRGFGVPLDRWFRRDLRAYLNAMLGSGTARVRAYLKPDAIDSLLAEHAEGRRSLGHTIWTLLTLEVFLRKEGW